MKSAKIFIISAPSRGGKDIVIRALKKEFGSALKSVINYTTRPRRDYEIQDVHYHFLTAAQFKKLIKARFFVEWAHVNGYLYGTPRLEIQKLLDRGQNVLWKLEVKGARQAIKKFPNQTVSIFLKPRSISELRKRFTGDHNFPPSQIRRRLNKARTEIKTAKKLFDNVVINADRQIKKTIKEVFKVVRRHI